jgi:putative ABC transport system permease protein
VLRQLLSENCVLALAGGAAGLVPALLLPGAIGALGPRLFPRLAEVRVDGAALLFTLGLALATGLLSGLAPALRLTASRLPAGLREGARGSSGPSGRRLRRALVAAELALSLTLLVGAGLMVRTLWRLLDVSPGFDSSGVLTMKVSLAGPRYEADPTVTGYYREVLARLRAAPGVESAAMTSQVPFGGNFDGNGLHPEGKMKPNPEEDPSAQRFGVSPDYLRVMRIPLVRGRSLTEADAAGAPPVLLVNQTAAAQVWPGEDPIGKRVKLGGVDGPWRTIVGVTGDVRHTALDEQPEPQMYVPHAQWRVDSQMILTVRTTRPPLSMAATLERIVRSVDPAQAVSSIAALDDLLGASVAARRLSLLLLALFAALALLLSAIGIYGVTAYAVAERTHEIGIRLALGARPAQLLRAVLAEGAALAAAGITAGVAAALALTRIMERLLYGVGPADPPTFAAVAALLAAVAMSACYIPARRVLRVEPSEALRGP